MSESLKKIEGISLDSIIKIEVSGGVYNRLHQMLMHHAQTKSIDEFAKALQKVKENKADDVYSYHLETLMVIIYGIETAAKEQNLIKSVDLPEQPQK